jgi:hypothetical protein
MSFDYKAPAELFMPKRRTRHRKPIGYRRFASAAEAIRFAVEDFPAVHKFGPWMQIEDERFNSDEIRSLYESNDYPLRRCSRLFP